MIVSLIKAHLFGSMKEDEERDCDLTWIDDSSAQGGDKGKLCWKRQFEHVQGHSRRDKIDVVVGCKCFTRRCRVAK